MTSSIAQTLENIVENDTKQFGFVLVFLDRRSLALAKSTIGGMLEPSTKFFVS